MVGLGLALPLIKPLGGVAELEGQGGGVGEGDVEAHGVVLPEYPIKFPALLGGQHAAALPGGGGGLLRGVFILSLFRLGGLGLRVRRGVRDGLRGLQQHQVIEQGGLRPLPQLQQLGHVGKQVPEGIVAQIQAGHPLLGQHRLGLADGDGLPGDENLPQQAKNLLFLQLCHSNSSSLQTSFHVKKRIAHSG